MKNRSCSIRDVAEYAQVATSTVSRVLNGRDAETHTSEETRRKIRAAAKALNYTPNINAKRLNTHKSDVIALVLPSYERHRKNVFSDHHLTEIFSGIEGGLADTDYRLLIVFNDRHFVGRREYLTLFRQRAVDGMLVWGDYDRHTFWEELAEQNYPFMFLSKPSIAVDSYNYVIHNYAQAGQMALEHLQLRRHRHIGWIGASPDNGIVKDIEAGFARAPGSVIHSYYGDFTGLCGRELTARALKEHPEITALLVANVPVAEGAQAALQEIARPVDIVACDYSFDEPPCLLPRIGVADHQLGARAVTLLTELIEGKKEKVQELLPVRLLT